MPQVQALTLYRGDCGHWTFTFWTDAVATEPYELTDATAKAELRAKPGAPLVDEFVCTITLPNTIELNLTAEQSALLSKRLVWDLQVTFPDACVKTLVSGSLVVTADVTGSTP